MNTSSTSANSPFLEWIGTRVEEWREGYARISLELRPEHMNRAGIVHGGLLATLLDHGGGFCGLYCPKPGHSRYGMTLSLTCNFMAQRKTGTLTTIGQKTAGGRKIYFSKTEIYADDGALIAAGTSVHRYRSGSENPDGVPTRTADNG